MTTPGPEARPDPSREFESLRPRLFGIAYRMTGSVADAEDLCQEAWVRWDALDVETVREPEAYLVRTVANLSIDRLRSAQRRREAYVGPSLPEPLVEQIAGTGIPPVGPERAAELADSLTLAFLVLLDELTPVERAVLLLHDVFGYSFDEVGGAVDRAPDACRQIASRTRRKLEQRSRSRRSASSWSRRGAALGRAADERDRGGQRRGADERCSPRTWCT